MNDKEFRNAYDKVALGRTESAEILDNVLSSKKKGLNMLRILPPGAGSVPAADDPGRQDPCISADRKTEVYDLL